MLYQKLENMNGIHRIHSERRIKGKWKNRYQNMAMQLGCWFKEQKFKLCFKTLLSKIGKCLTIWKKMSEFSIELTTKDSYLLFQSHGVASYSENETPPTFADQLPWRFPTIWGDFRHGELRRPAKPHSHCGWAESSTMGLYFASPEAQECWWVCFWKMPDGSASWCLILENVILNLRALRQRFSTGGLTHV